MTLSPKSLFDLRYLSLPKTEKVININYKELSFKINKNKDYSYILYDKYKKDITFIKLDISPNLLNSHRIMEDTAEFQLLNNNNEFKIIIYDIFGFAHLNEDSQDNDIDENDYIEDKKSLYMGRK